MKPIQFATGKKTPVLHQMHGTFGNQPGPNKFGDVAALPGSGPTGQLCKYCDLIRHNKNATQWGRCKKAATLRRLSVAQLSMIPLTTLACSHFKERGPDDKPWLHRADFARDPEPQKDPVMF